MAMTIAIIVLVIFAAIEFGFAIYDVWRDEREERARKEQEAMKEQEK